MIIGFVSKYEQIKNWINKLNWKFFSWKYGPKMWVHIIYGQIWYLGAEIKLYGCDSSVQTAHSSTYLSQRISTSPSEPSHISCRLDKLSNFPFLPKK